MGRLRQWARCKKAFARVYGVWGFAALQVECASCEQLERRMCCMSAWWAGRWKRPCGGRGCWQRSAGGPQFCFIVGVPYHRCVPVRARPCVAGSLPLGPGRKRVGAATGAADCRQFVATLPRVCVESLCLARMHVSPRRLYTYGKQVMYRVKNERLVSSQASQLGCCQRTGVSVEPAWNTPDFGRAPAVRSCLKWNRVKPGGAAAERRLL